MLTGMLAGCELPSSLEELAKVFEGQTQEIRDDQVSAVAEQPQDDVEAEAAAALRDEATEQAKAADAAAPKPTRETILTAQKLLAGLGYEPGPLDGLDGPKTRGAVRRYQADAGHVLDLDNSGPQNDAADRHGPLPGAGGRRHPGSWCAARSRVSNW